ncbi:hypothetical protein GP486_006906 [Trichoglossum hirsutum]|uniref:Myb-like domain-containing protein n=1 Tax=Trichoglossum hirsutum TaxID=265104 RepID=A0A9P8L7Q3_9PEZI|nr:hypothetical protein GP486_006906 [Trichoglossum hirsutum]
MLRAWEADDDKKLEELKEAGANWKDISVTMERPPHDVKRRYGELRRARADTEKKKTAESTAPKGKGRDEGTSSAGMTLPFLQADKDWSKDELALLLDIARRYEDTKWLYIASGFYDKTGRRVTAEEVKKKLGG